MAYTKIVFQNSPSTATPLNAENLNHMDDQIALNDQRLTELEGAHVSSFNGRTGAVAPADGDYDIGQIAPLSGAQVGQVPVVTNIGTEEDPELVFRMGAGGGAGGHTIQNSAGTDLPQEDKLQFADSHVSDDSTNGRTIVENIKEVASADYPSETEDGIYLIPDGDGAVIESASDDYVEVVADGDKTLSTLLNELFALTDFSKIRDNGYITINISGRRFIYLADDLDIPHNSATFIWSDVYAHSALISIGLEVSANPIAEQFYNGAYSDVSNTKYANGTKITLYYGNKKATVDLQTTANRCLMGDGTTVQNRLTTNVISETETVTPSVGQTVYKEFTMPNDGKTYVCTVTISLGTSKSAKAQIFATGTALLSSIAATFIDVSDMPIDCAQPMTLFANGNGGNLRINIWTRSTDSDTYTIRLNAVSI